MDIAILQADNVDLHILKLTGQDYPTIYQNFLNKCHPNLSFKVYNLQKQQRPPNLLALDAVIITGSRHSAYDDHLWIQKAKELVIECHQKAIKCVGICFGHQLIASALGGEVKAAENGWEIGVHEINICHQASWMNPKRQTCHLPFSHQDIVSKAPPGAKILARNWHCECQIFQVQQNTLGIQGHPEMQTRFLKELIKDRYEGVVEPGVVKNALESLKITADGDILGRWIMNFIQDKIV